jgi:hypothetical protein
LFDEVKEDKSTEHVARMGEMRNVYKILVGEPDGKGTLGRPTRRREENIRVHNTEMV